MTSLSSNTSSFERESKATIALIAIVILVMAFLSTAFASSAFASTNTPTKDSINIVFDDANIFTKYEVDELNKFAESNYNSFGVVVAVATIDKLPAGTSIESWTLNKANGLGVGSSTEDNGLFYGISVKDREFYVAKGSGYSAVSDSNLQTILNKNLVTSFKQGNYSEGVRESAAAFGEYVKYQLPQKNAQQDYMKEHAPFYIISFLVIFGAFLTALFTSMHFVSKKNKKKAAEILAKDEKIKNNFNLISEHDWEEYSTLPNKTSREEWLSTRRLYAKLLELNEYGDIADSDKTFIDSKILQFKYLGSKPDENETIKSAYTRRLDELDKIEKKQQANQEARNFWNNLSNQEKKEYKGLDSQGREQWLDSRNAGGGSFFDPTNILLMTAISSIAYNHGRDSSSSSTSQSSYSDSSFGGGSFSGGSGGSW